MSKTLSWDVVSGKVLSKAVPGPVITKPLGVAPSASSSHGGVGPRPRPHPTVVTRRLPSYSTLLLEEAHMRRSLYG